MARRTFLLILLLLLAVVLLWVVSSQTKREIPKPQKVEQKPTQVAPTPRIETALSASPSAGLLTVGQPLNLKVTINTGGNNVSAVQLEVAFDPIFLEISKITPGEFFTQSTVLLEEIDNKNGRLSYALGNLTPRQGSGTLVNITLLPKKKTAGQSTSFNFLPKTAVAALDSRESSVLRQAIGGQFIIN